MSREFIVRVNCEYSERVTVRDDQDAEDAIRAVENTDLAGWDKAWSDFTAEEE